MTDKLALQREILAAIDDPDKLAAIAEREGIDPALWRYSTDLFKAVAELAKSDLKKDG